LLQIQLEDEIIDLYLNEPDFKYLTALGAFYTRMTCSSVVVYKKLEPLLMDKRKLRKKLHDGSFEITFMDQFVDDLLTKERVLDCILPRLAKRYILEDLGELDPRISPLEDELEEEDEEKEEEVVEPVESEKEEKIEIKLEEIDPLKKKNKKYSTKKVLRLFKKVEKKKVAVEEEEEKPSGFKDGSLSYHETNILRANLGLAPLE
jgi:pre-mRNA-splicing factor 38A